MDLYILIAVIFGIVSTIVIVFNVDDRGYIGDFDTDSLDEVLFCGFLILCASALWPIGIIVLGFVVFFKMSLKVATVIKEKINKRKNEYSE